MPLLPGLPDFGIVNTNGANRTLLEHIEYRCALVAEAVYYFDDLKEYDIPFADDEQIQKVFAASHSDLLFRLFDKTGGFHAKLYHDVRTDQFILGFGGTEPVNPDDWLTNIYQFFGSPASQYERGCELVKRIRPDYHHKVTLTGHSLGGGIATVAAIQHKKLHAIVFNPPAIHRKTIKQFDVFLVALAENRVRRFVVFGEILDSINQINHSFSMNNRLIGKKETLYGSFDKQSLVAVAGGTLVGMLSWKQLVKYINPAAGIIVTAATPAVLRSFQLHSMAEVKKGLEKWFAENRRERQIGILSPDVPLSLR
jgi:pimeloyl-ACP methyl ester carboxylesterase